MMFYDLAHVLYKRNLWWRREQLKCHGFSHEFSPKKMFEICIFILIWEKEKNCKHTQPTPKG